MFKNGFNLSDNSKVRGSGLIVLNILRAFNIIALLAVAVAHWILIVIPPLKQQHFFFFDFASHFFTSMIAVFLIVSETGLLESFFKRDFPVLGPDHGFYWLGLAMIMLGCNALSQTNKPGFTADDLGMPLFRVVLAAGILCLIFGFLNFVASFVYRDPGRRIAAREFRRDGNLAKGKNYDDMYSDRSSGNNNNNNSSSMDEDYYEKVGARARRYTQAFIGKFNGRRPEISKPIPHHGGDVERGATAHSTTADGDAWAQERGSPIAQGVQRPPTALHPAFTAGSRSSRYSVASHLNRF